MKRILQNTTFAVDAGLVDEYLEFMRRRYLSGLTAAGATACLLSRMVTDADMPPCFALQHRRPDVDCGDIDSAISQLKGEMASRWGDGVVWFDSVLEIIEDSDDGRSC